jgi:hypothetical protein
MPIKMEIQNLPECHQVDEEFIEMCTKHHRTEIKTTFLATCDLFKLPRFWGKGEHKL